MDLKEITNEIWTILETNANNYYDVLLEWAEDKEKTFGTLVEECAECYAQTLGYTIVEYLRNLDFAAQVMFDESSLVSDLVKYLNETHCWIK